MNHVIRANHMISLITSSTTDPKYTKYQHNLFFCYIDNIKYVFITFHQFFSIMLVLRFPHFFCQRGRHHFHKIIKTRILHFQRRFLSKVLCSLYTRTSFFSEDIQGQERLRIMHECALCNPNDGMPC
jgi:hypothetical protein